MSVIALIGCQRPAAPQMVLPTHQGQRAAQRARIREWAEIARAIVLLEAGQGEARNRIMQIHLEQQEPFIIAETDVVARVKLLNQLAFEQQGFGFTAHQVEIKIVDALDQRLEFQVPTHSP